MIRKRTAPLNPLAIAITATLAMCMILPAATQAQQPGNTAVQKLVSQVDTFYSRMPSEKLYLHFDKPYYAIGDTIWFKAYLFQGASHVWSPLSGLLYIELISDSDKLVKRMSFPAAYGISWGQLPLNPDELSGGGYTLYAYTNWMQNAGPACFFHQHFAIGEAAEKYWLVKENHRLSGSDMTLAVQLSETDTRPARQKDIRIKVTEGRKTLYHGDVQTGSDGVFHTSFSLPAKSTGQGITLVAEDKSDPERKAIVPLAVSRPENIDLQFMPESGYLVAGLSSRVGFKAIGENGRGVDIKGKIVNGQDKVVATFASIHKGMGEFEFTPVAGDTYSAVVVLPGSGPQHYPLPPVKSSGTILHITHGPDSLYINISFSANLQGDHVYHLLGLARGLVCYGANMKMDKAEVHGRVSKTAFPTGVAHFTLFNEEGQPVNERLVFIDQHDNLAVDIDSDKPLYMSRDSVALHIQVADKDKQPVVGSFSLAVTDDAQVKADSLIADNIISRLLLSTDLKGNIEEPSWYFLHQGDSATAEALDALMLTQGWTGYNWPTIFKKPPVPAYAAQPGFTVTGKVTNLLNKPLSKANVLLMTTGKRFMVRDTVTGTDGRFTFANFPIVDTPAFVVQARNAKGKNMGIGIEVDEFKPAQLHAGETGSLLPWYVNGDSILLSYVKNNYERQQDELTGGGKFKVLKTVTVRGKKGIRGSANLNGAGEADQVIDEAAIEKAGNKLNLKELLLKTVKGFRIVYGKDGTERYKIFANDLNIIIDGLHLGRFGQERETLEYLQATDIKGIEVMHSMRHAGNYRTTFLTPQQLMDISKEYSFLEITTHSGNGIFLKHTPGVYVYKPLPVTWPVAFYAPRYTIKQSSSGLHDLRSTIYWQPNLVTDKQGRAETSFYTADKASSYTLILQGSDMNGNIGFKMKKIVVKN